jgi:hypothetical protein
MNTSSSTDFSVGPPARASAEIPAAQDEHEFCVKLEPIPTGGSESRRFPRLDFRACVQALVHAPPGDPGAAPTSCQVLTRDISRSGMNLLHKTQVFPGQMIDLTLPNGQQRRLEVVWCRRLGMGCYSVGCRFVKTDGPGD